MDSSKLNEQNRKFIKETEKIITKESSRNSGADEHKEWDEKYHGSFNSTLD